MRLRTILVTLACLAFFATSAGGYFYYSSLKEYAYRDAWSRSIASAEVISGRLSSMLEEQLKCARALAGLEPLSKALLFRNPESIFHANMVLDHFRDALNVDVCYLMDLEGNTLASSNRHARESFVGKNYSFRPYFRAARQGNPGIHMAVGVTSRKRGAYLSYPVYAEGDPTPVGVAVIKASIEHLESEFEDIYEGIVLVTDAQGMVFLSTRPGWLYLSCWKESTEVDPVNSAMETGGGVPSGWTGLRRRGDQQAVDMSGMEYLVQQIPIQRYPGWNVVYLTDLESLSKKLSDPLLRVTGYIIATLCLFVGFAVLFLYDRASYDIFRRKNAEDALQENERKFRMLVETMNEGLCGCNEYGGITYVNEKLCRMLEYPREELVGRSLAGLFDEPSRSLIEDRIRSGRSGETTTCEIEYAWKDGRGHAAIVSVSPVLDETGTFAGAIAVLTDITDLKKTERMLKVSEEKYRLIFEHSPLGIMRFDHEGIITDCNEKLVEICGSSKEALVGFSLFDSVKDPDMQKAIRECITGREGLYEGCYESVTGGKTTPVKVNFSPILTEDGTRLGGMGLFEDITERWRAEEELRASEERLKLLFEYAPDAYYLTDLHGNIVDGNQSAEAVTGYDRKDLVGQNILEMDLLRSDQVSKALNTLKANAKGHPTGPDEFTFFRKNGEAIILEIRSFPTRIGDRTLVLSIARDITSRKKAEEALIQSEKKLRHLSARLLKAEEDERKRISRELHDSIGSSLTAVKFYVEHMLLQTRPDSVFFQPLTNLVSVVEHAIEESRRIMTDLRPSMLDDLGIVSTLDWYCREFMKIHSHIHIEKQVYVDEEVIPEPLKIVVFRIVQEALNNVAKHSGAEYVELAVVKTGEILELTVEDNGTGFHAGNAINGDTHLKGLGLTSMKERVELSQGRFMLESAPGRGTTIRASWPIG